MNKKEGNWLQLVCVLLYVQSSTQTFRSDEIPASVRSTVVETAVLACSKTEILEVGKEVDLFINIMVPNIHLIANVQNRGEVGLLQCLGNRTALIWRDLKAVVKVHDRSKIGPDSLRRKQFTRLFIANGILLTLHHSVKIHTQQAQNAGNSTTVAKVSFAVFREVTELAAGLLRDDLNRYQIKTHLFQMMQYSAHKTAQISSLCLEGKWAKLLLLTTMLLSTRNEPRGIRER